MRDVDTTLARTLATSLNDAGYTYAGLASALGDDAMTALLRGDAAPARYRALGIAEATRTALRLFWWGETCSREDVERLWPQTPHAHNTVAELRDALIIEETHQGIRSIVAVRPYAFRDTQGSGQWWIASDLDEVAGVSPLREDHVLGVGGAGRTLAGLIPPLHVKHSLDLGSGCGVLSLHLRRFSDAVVATDISKRAVWFTRFTAALNAVDRIEVRVGDLFEPVAGEQFDLVVSNPPFVITPRADNIPSYEYRDAGQTGDALMERVLRGLHDVLAPSGRAVLLGNWEESESSRGLDRVAFWTNDLNTWVIEREHLNPQAYAQMWARDGGALVGSAAYEHLVAAWLNDFDHRLVTGIGLGWIMLQRRDTAGATWTRVERLSQPVTVEHVGAHLGAAWAMREATDALSDTELEALHVYVAPDVTEARHYMPGMESPSVIELQQGGGLGRTMNVDPALAGLVGACDGDLTIGVIIDALAELLEVDVADLRGELLPAVRELLFTGFLSLESMVQPEDSLGDR